MLTPLRTPLRPGQAGDICILLEPADPTEIHALRQHQNALQQLFGGQISDPVHITCQRFQLTDPYKYSDLLDQLRYLAVDYQPFQISAQGLVPLFSSYRQMLLLKWEIPLEPWLVTVSTRLEQILVKLAINSLYPPGWVSTLVTALIDINPDSTQPPELFPDFPHPLFTPTILTLSKLHGPSEFEIMDRIELWKF